MGGPNFYDAGCPAQRTKNRNGYQHKVSTNRPSSPMQLATFPGHVPDRIVSLVAALLVSSLTLHRNVLGASLNELRAITSDGETDSTRL